MAEIKKPVKQTYTPLFTRENYLLMVIGGVIILIGMLLMTGGKNPDPNVFDRGIVYSTNRITFAPIIILIGFVVEIYAIFKKPAVKI